ncbi:hypothetical protein PR048_028275 [Dryococelus australis]|uniref:PiggyBac transposable element-derived protein domain-containing protein n=1 Tax=Dryococelus australis TaxID=614101 RepID=A0ABQ9GIS9_9NEOP|nr:hypothetical protein PR048_028275 [Dryococelus australis]
MTWYGKESDCEDNVETIEEVRDIITELTEANESNCSESEREEEQDRDAVMFTTKSGMKWSPMPLCKKYRKPACNIVSYKPTTMDARKDSIIGLFSLFLPPEMLDIICRHTNVKGKQIFELFNQQHPEKPIEWNDMQVKYVVIKQLFQNYGPAIQLFATNYTMSRSRFQLLSAFVRFDDKITRCTRIEESGNKLQAVREVFDIFVKACIQNYRPKENLTVDERLAAYCGKCPFRVHMKSKPGC